MANAGHVSADTHELGDLSRALRGALPRAFEPELATLVESVPDGDGWLHEMKFDGYRIIARRDRRSVQMLTRRGLDWSHRVSSLVASIARLPVESLAVDGELVALRADGTTDFQQLQNSLRDGAEQRLVYYLFDLLYIDGFDLRSLPLESRKAVLERIIQSASATGDDLRLRYSEHIIGHGRDFFARACELGLEGVVSKRRGSTYRAGRGKDWLKTKCAHRQEFAIGGYTEPSGSRAHLGALLLGTFDEPGRLLYRGKVGTGFSERSLQDLYRRLAPLEEPRPAFVNPPRGSEAHGVHWVRPELVAEVRYTEATGDGMLRHPSFQGLRDDKHAVEVHLERPAAPEPVVSRDRSRMASRSRIAGIALTHPSRIMFPEAGITKLDLAEYYEKVAQWMLPHVVGRPLTLLRCPEGRSERGFYQKQPMPGMPDAIHRVRVLDKEKGKPTYNTAVYDLSGVIALVQMGVLEVHTWGSRADRPDRPDRMVLDLDPGPGVPWSHVVEGARLLREALTELGLASFLKATGGKGLHVVVPCERRLDWNTLKRFAKAVAELLVRTAPSRYVAVSTKAKRQGRVYVDYLRNGYGATSICPLSTRARPGAPVSMPLAWDELDRMEATQFTIANAFERLRALSADPWRDFFTTRQAVTAEMRRRVGMV